MTCGPCPALAFQPIKEDGSYRTTNVNFQRLLEWHRQLCSLIECLDGKVAALEAANAALEARIAALEAAP